MTIDILRSDHLGIMVSSVDDAVSWYVSNLGATVTDRWTAPEVNMAWAHISLGDTKFEFVERPGLGAVSVGNVGPHHIGLVVDDCASAVDQLVAAGGRLMTPPAHFDRHDMDWSFVSDPFGNVLEIIAYRGQLTGHAT